MKIKLDKLDILFSKYIRLRAGGVCEYCSQAKTLQCSHFHGRRKKSVRWDGENACALCFSCHMYLGENPYQHTIFFEKRLGTQGFEMLNIRANMIIKPDREAIEASLREKLRLLEDR